MGKRQREPSIPPERHETIRREIIEILEARTLSAKEISGAAGISEKEAYDHLDHIQKTVHIAGFHLILTPAECKRCGFVFRKREKLKKPGKCPVCRSESIEDPLFSIRKAEQ